jgi:AcrR family transcriptional regulator
MTEAEIPEPPWRQVGRERPSRTPLNQDAIVRAALEVVRKEGAEALSMRRVADELDTGPATLYWHVGSKDGLIELVLDRVFSEIELPTPDPERWQEQVKELVLDARRVFSRYPGLGALTLGRIPMGPTLVRWIEWTLSLLRQAGIPDNIAAYSGDLFGLYIGAHALEEAAPLRSATGEDLEPHEIVGMIRGYFESLPEDRFPNIQETVDELTSPDPDRRFELGIEIIIRGMATYVKR